MPLETNSLAHISLRWAQASRACYQLKQAPFPLVEVLSVGKCHIVSIPFFTGSSVSTAESLFSLKAIQGKTGSVNDLGPGCPPNSCLSFLPVRPHSESLQADAGFHHSMATGSGHDFGPCCTLIACLSSCSPIPEIAIATSCAPLAQQYGPREWVPRYSAARGLLAQL